MDGVVAGVLPALDVAVGAGAAGVEPERCGVAVEPGCDGAALDGEEAEAEGEAVAEAAGEADAAGLFDGEACGGAA